MNDTAKSYYSVSGMKCDGCVASAMDALSKLPGFSTATFDLAKGTAEVSGDVEPTVVAKALTDAGYPAVVVDR